MRVEKLRRGIRLNADMSNLLTCRKKSLLQLFMPLAADDRPASPSTVFVPILPVPIASFPVNAILYFYMPSCSHAYLRQEMNELPSR